MVEKSRRISPLLTSASLYLLQFLLLEVTFFTSLHKYVEA
jgi:hypothetical protein